MDGPRKMLGFSPRIQQEKFSGFFTAAAGWGTVGQLRDEQKQTNTVELKYGRLSLSSLTTSAVRSPKRVALSLDGSLLPVTWHTAGDAVTIQFNELQMVEGQRLQIVLE